MAFVTPSYVSGQMIRDILLGQAVDLDAAGALKATLFSNSVAAGDPNNAEAYGTAPWTSGTELGPAGGTVLTGVTIADPAAAAARKIILTASSFAITSATFTAQGVLVFLPGISNRVLAAINFGAPQPVVSGTFTVQWDATNGIFAATYCGVTVALILTVDLAASADDAEWFNATFNGNRNYVQLGSHVTETLGPWAAFRFPVSQSFKDIDPAWITDVRVKWRAVNSANMTAYWRVNQAAQAVWAGTGTERPDTRYASIGTTGQVLQAVHTETASTDYTSPDLSARVKTALPNLSVGQYLGVVAGPDAAAAGVSIVQAASWDHTTFPAPQLVITYDPPPSDRTVTTTAPTLGLTPGSPLTYELDDNVPYGTDVGNTTRRVVDVYKPTGAAPPGGWPVFFFVHGGGFVGGDEDDARTNTTFLGDLLSRGAVVAVSYKFAALDYPFNLNTGWAQPALTQDVMAAAAWVKANAVAENFDLTNVIGVAYSAGTFLLLHTALMVADPDRDNYNATGGTNGLGRTFDLNYAQGRPSSAFPTFKGVLLFVPPVNLDQIAADNALIRPNVMVMHGRLPQDEFAVVNGETNLDDYIEGKAGTIWATGGKGPEEPPFAIGVIYSDEDITVSSTSGRNALRDALIAVGYDTSTPQNTVAEGVLYTERKFSSSQGNPHDTVLLLDYPIVRPFQNDWIDAQLASTVLPPVDLAGTSAGSGTGIGTLTTGGPPPEELAATSAGLGVATAALTTTVALHELIASSPGVGVVTATLGVIRPIAATSAGTSSGSGVLNQFEEFTATTHGQAIVAGTLVVNRALVATSPGLGAVTGALTVIAAGAVALDSAAQGFSTLSGVLGVIRPVSGSSAGLGAATGTLATSAPIRTLAATVDGSSGVTGSLSISRVLVGGVSVGSAGAFGQLSLVEAGFESLQGASAGVGAAQGTLTTVAPSPTLDVLSAGLGTASGALSVVGAVETLAGTVAGAGTVAATALTVLAAPPVDLVATSAGLGVGTGVLGIVEAGAVTLVGRSAGVAVLDSDLTVVKPPPVDLTALAEGAAVVTGGVLVELYARMVADPAHGTGSAVGTLSKEGRRAVAQAVNIAARRSDVDLTDPRQGVPS